LNHNESYCVNLNRFGGSNLQKIYDSPGQHSIMDDRGFEKVFAVFRTTWILRDDLAGGVFAASQIVVVAARGDAP
jgi:hypothetical protein